MNQAYVEYFLGSSSQIIQFELIEISHPDFTKTYRIVRNSVNGLTVTLENSNEAFFEYIPLSLNESEATDNLDFSIDVELGELSEIVPSEIDAILSADNLSVKPTLIYRAYRSDDLTQPMYGPVSLEITSFTMTKTGAVFSAKAPTLSLNETGEVYNIARFPMLRGFL